MTAIGKDIVSGDGIPDIHHFVVTTGSDKPAIGRPGHTIEAGGGIAVDDKFLTGSRIPYLQAFVITHRGNALTVGRPDQAVDPARMPFVEKLASRRQSKRSEETAFVFVWTPHLNAPIFATGGN